MSFIICSRKRSMPKVSTSICKKCARVRKCPDYRLFEQPMLFPDMKKGAPGKTSKRAQTRVKIRQTPSSEIQFPINFMSSK